MESIKDKTIYLVETTLKSTNISLSVPRYVYGIEETKDFFLRMIASKTVENFYAMFMSGSNEVVAVSCIAKGDSTNVIISISEIIRIALLSNAKYILIAHNHPSGIAKPSDSDQKITKQIAQAASLFNIQLIDSIIVCENGEVCSLRRMIAEE